MKKKLKYALIAIALSLLFFVTLGIPAALKARLTMRLRNSFPKKSAGVS